MTGAFEPHRYVGRRLHLTENIWQIMMVLVTIIGIYFVIKANRNPKFLDSTNFA